MSAFENRPRYSRDDAVSLMAQPTNAIQHLLENEDGTFSVMMHIVCEYCDYCAAEAEGVRTHRAQEDPYARVGR